MFTQTQETLGEAKTIKSARFVGPDSVGKLTLSNTWTIQQAYGVMADIAEYEKTGDFGPALLGFLSSTPAFMTLKYAIHAAYEKCAKVMFENRKKIKNV